MEQKKKISYPLPLRILRATFPVVEKLAPRIADQLMLKFFYTPINFKPTPAEDEALSRSQQEVVDFNGKSIVAYAWGEGKPILCTHGWAGRGTQFRKFVDPFIREGFKLVTFDAPAHGRSQGKRTNLREFQQVIIDLEKRHGPFHGSIGHSFGGVVNMFCKFNGMEIPRMIMIGSPTRTEDILDDFLLRINGSSARIQPFLDYIENRYGVAFDDVTAIRMAEKMNMGPVLLVHDTDDKDVGWKQAEALLPKLEQGRLYTTRGLGHNRILKDEAVIQECLDFLQA